MRAAGLLVTCVLAAGCVRDAADAVCPVLAEGDLVVTEIGGPQTGNELHKPWVELYNASDAAIDLLGVKIRFRRMDGSGENAIIVRRSVLAAPGSYTVLGLDDDDDRASYLDYGFLVDYHASWLSSAAVDVEACGELIDRARYSSLPREGSYSLGTMPPTALENEVDANWCIDPTLDSTGGFPIPGTPQQANAVCP